MEDVNIIQTLNDFINRAERERQYPLNTANGFRSPLKLIDPELTDEEKSSLEVLESKIELILNSIYQKGDSGLSASSLQEYKRRVKKLINDYKEYGLDPAKLASWNRHAMVKKFTSEKKERKSQKNLPKNVRQQEPSSSYENSVELGEFKLVLPAGWDMDSARKAIARGDFKLVYDELEKLSQKFAKPEETNEEG